MTERVRPVLAGIVGVIAMVGLLCSIAGIWARATVFDETEVAAAVEQAIDEPGVTDALAVRLATDVVVAVDLEGVVGRVLTGRLQPLAPAIVQGATNLLQSRLTELLADPGTRRVMVGVFEDSYAAFLAVVRGEGLVDGVSVEHGEVTVNFLPVMAEAMGVLQRLGFAPGVTIPTLVRQDDPSDQIAELEQAFERELPADFGQLVVYRSESLASAGRTLDQVQRLLLVVDRALLLIVIVTLLSLVGAVLLARDRLRAIVILLLSAAGLLLVMRAVVNKLLEDVVAVAETPAGEAALAAATRSLADALLSLLAVGAVLCVLAALVVRLADPDSAIRRRLAATSGEASLGATVAAHRSAVALVAFATALLVVTLAGLDLLPAVLALVLAAVGLVVWRMPARPAGVSDGSR